MPVMQATMWLAMQVPLTAAAATLVGLVVFGRGLEAEPQRKRPAEVGTRESADHSKEGSDRAALSSPQNPGGLTHGSIEATRLWGIAAATASGFGAGLGVLLVGSVWAKVLIIPGEYRIAFFSGGVGFLVLAVVLVMIAPTWFRAPRMITPTGRWHGPDSGISYFQARQVLLGVFVGVPLMLALAGVIASAVASTATAGEDCVPKTTKETDRLTGEASCFRDIESLLDLRRSFMQYLLAALVLLVIVTIVIALAQRALRYRADHEIYYYRASDVLLFGGMLSILTAVIVLPAYAVLQASGYQLTRSAMRFADPEVSSDWFKTRDSLLDSLSPALGPQFFLAGLLTIATPLLTGALTAWLTGRRERKDGPNL